MKPILFILVCLLTVHISSAQKIELGANAGLLYNTSCSINSGSSGTMASSVTATGSLSMECHIHHYSIGLAAGIMQPSYQTNLNGVWLDAEYFTIDNPIYNYKVFVNRYFKIGPLEIYTGLSAGVLSYDTHQLGGLAGVHIESYGTGNLYGLQIGGTYFITKHLGLNAEIAYNYLQLKKAYFNGNFSAQPATLGIHYRF